MNKFNTLIKRLIESNTNASVYGAAAVANKQYASGDNRPIEPARAAIGAKFKKRKKNEPSQVMVPVFRRPRVESIVSVNK
jgi:hypothetical protein